MIAHKWMKCPNRRKEMFYLTTHSTHFIYGYMASDIWLRTILIVRKETRCRHIGYSLRLAARVLLYAPSHRQDSTYHGLCCTSRGALAGTRNSSMGPPWRIDPTTHRTMSERSYHGATSCSVLIDDKCHKVSTTNVATLNAANVTTTNDATHQPQLLHWRRKRGVCVWGGGGGDKGARAPHIFAWGGGMVCLCPPHTHFLPHIFIFHLNYMFI